MPTSRSRKLARKPAATKRAMAGAIFAQKGRSKKATHLAKGLMRSAARKSRRK